MPTHAALCAAVTHRNRVLNVRQYASGAIPCAPRQSQSLNTLDGITLSNELPPVMTLSIWPVEPAKTLGEALVDTRVVSSVLETPSYEAGEALTAGRADVALVPTLDVLLQPDRFELVSSVALVGQTSPLKKLVVRSALDAIDSVAFDPRYKAEALLAQHVLRENYRQKPTFVPLDPEGHPLSSEDAALIDVGSELEENALDLDLGKEWIELTLRPMVWGLLAARPGELSDEVVSVLQEAAREIDPGDDPQFQFTLDGYAVAGLDEYIQHLFFTGTLTDFPELRFYQSEEDQSE